MPIINGQTYYTPPEVAEQLGRSRATVTRWCREGRVFSNVLDLGEGKAMRWLIPASELIDPQLPKLGRPFDDTYVVE
jgi:hypothetical protein